MAGRSAQEIYDNLTNVKSIPSKELSAHYDRWAFEARDLPGSEKYPILRDTDPETLSQRISAAQSLSYSLLPRGSAAAQGRVAHSKGAVAGAYVEILKNKDKYGLEGKTEEEVLEAAWYSAETNDRLNPDKIKGDLVKKKQEERRALLEEKIKDKKALEAQYQIDAAKIAAQGPSEKELRDARREETIAFLEARMQDQMWSSTTTNSLGELYGAEGLAISAAALGKAGDISGLSEKIGELGSKSGAVGGLLKAGKYYELYSNPSGYLSSKAGGALTKYASKRASQWAVKAAVAVGLNAVAPGIGMLAEELVSRVLAPFLQKAILGSYDRVKNSLKTAGQALGGLAVIIGSSMASGMAVGATTTAVSAIVLVPLVAFIMFIINAGGYIVPPGPHFSGTEGNYNVEPGNGGNPVVNSYLSVTKTANPAGPFGNSELPLSVEYTITITAKQQALTNIHFSYNCNAIGDAPVIYCPPVNPQIPTPPARIEAGPSNAFIIKYTVQYPASFKNTIAMDTFVVTADGTVGDVKNIKETGFASVQFGTIPTACFKLDGFWPDQQKAMIIAAIGQLLGYKNYVNKICSSGDVSLQYISNISEGHGLFNGTRYWGQTFTQPLRIEFYPVGFGSAGSVFFTLAHESGHVLTHTRPALFQLFADTVTLPQDHNGYICTYPFRNDSPPIACVIGQLRCSEDFAESAALYAIGSGLNASNRNYACLLQEGNKDGTFRGGYPSLWSFMNSNVF